MTMIPSLWCVHDCDANCLMCAWPWSQLFDVLQLPTSGSGPTETHSDGLVALPPTLYNGTSNPSCTHVTNAPDVICDVTTRRWKRHEVFWMMRFNVLRWTGNVKSEKCLSAWSFRKKRQDIFVVVHLIDLALHLFILLGISGWSLPAKRVYRLC